LSQVVDPGQNITVPQGIEVELEIVELEIVEPSSRKRSRTWDAPLSVSRSFSSDALCKVAEFRLEPQEEGGFVAFSNDYPGAVGQGETEEEALKDLQQAISLLREVLIEEKTGR